MAAVFVLSMRPMPADVPDINGIDKLYHLLAYTVMGLLWARAKGYGGVREKGDIIVTASVITAVYGAFIEVCQYFTGYRSAELADAVVNALGGVIGSYVYWRFASKEKKEA